MISAAATQVLSEVALLERRKQAAIENIKQLYTNLGQWSTPHPLFGQIQEAIQHDNWRKLLEICFGKDPHVRVDNRQRIETSTIKTEVIRKMHDYALEVCELDFEIWKAQEPLAA